MLGEPGSRGDWWASRRHPARPQPGAGQGATNARPVPVVAEDAARPRHQHRGREMEPSCDVHDVGCQRRLADAHDAPGVPIAAPRAADDAGSKRRNPTDGVPRAEERERGKDVLASGDRPQPFAAEPEPRALVAQKRPEPTGARPAATGVATNGDRAGSSEDQHAGLPIERAEESRLSVWHDQDPVREAVQALRQAPALTLGPDALRRDDERRHGACRPLLTLPELT